MADEEWQDVTGGAINLKKNPGPHTGTYIGSEKKSGGQFGDEYIHSFFGDEGAPFSIYGMTTLDRALVGRIPSGTRCRITFLGKEKTKDGKRDFNNVRLQVAKGAAIAESSQFDPDDEIPV